MHLDACVDIALGVIPVRVREDFLQDPIAAIKDGLGLSVTPAAHLVESRQDGGACDGISFLKDGVILFAPSANSRRQFFTLAHEVGHWAVKNAPDDVHDWIADEDESERMLETICDRVAARLLLPQDAVTAIVKSGPVRAQHVLDLFAVTSASHPACAIALSNRLQGLGAVVIVDRRSGEVTQASIRPDPNRGWPRVFPWRGQTIHDTHLLMRMQDGETRTKRLTWEMPWKTSAEYYIDAVSDGRRVYVVFSAADVWGVDVFHPADDREFDGRPVLTGHCCKTAFEVRGYPCSECEQPFCPSCKRCRCDRNAQREAMCKGTCFTRYLPHLLVDGLCEDCR